MPGLGNKLKLSREKFGLTLEEVGEELNIQKEHLMALEEEDFYFFPDKISAQNILERYSGFLGMETEEILQELDKEWANEGAIKDFIQKTFVPAGEVPDPVPGKKKSLLIGGLIVALILAVVSTSVFNRQPEPPTGTGQSQKEVSVEKEQKDKQEASSPGSNEGTETGKALPADKENQVSPEKTTAPEVVEPGKTQPVTGQAAENKGAESNDAGAYKGKVEVELTTSLGDCWLEVTVDGKRVFYDLALKGSKPLKFEGKKEISILFGNAGAVELKYNGKNLGPAGPMGSVIKRDFLPGK